MLPLMAVWRLTLLTGRGSRGPRLDEVDCGTTVHGGAGSGRMAGGNERWREGLIVEEESGCLEKKLEMNEKEGSGRCGPIGNGLGFIRHRRRGPIVNGLGLLRHGSSKAPDPLTRLWLGN
jgi:hypothetical protein